MRLWLRECFRAWILLAARVRRIITDFSKVNRIIAVQINANFATLEIWLLKVLAPKDYEVILFPDMLNYGKSVDIENRQEIVSILLQEFLICCVFLNVAKLDELEQLEHSHRCANQFTGVRSRRNENGRLVRATSGKFYQVDAAALD